MYMTASNLITQYKTILTLFIICNVINIPLLVYRKQIANDLSSRGNIEKEKKTLFQWLSYITLFLATLINIPLMTKLNSIIFFWIYIILFILLSIVNPIGIFTTNPLMLISVIVAVPFIFAMIKMLDLQKDINTWLFVGLVCVLTIFNDNMIHTLYTNISTYPYFISYSILYLLGYIIAMRQQSINIKEMGESIKTFFKRYNVSLNKIFVIEIAIILLYFYIRTLTKKYYGGKLLVHNPIPLHESTGYTITDKPYEYTISSWINFNAQGPNYNRSSAEFTSILLYANSVMVSYQANTNTLRVTIRNKDEKHSFDFHPKLQSWNHLVLMYSNGTFDIFINGDLKDTATIVPSVSDHQLNVGSDKGVLGKICSVLYYNSSIDTNKIERLYLDFKEKDPPTF
jgi:hypothetical protein